MLVRRTLGVVALVLVTAWLPATAASAAAAGDAPRELALEIGQPSPDHVALRAVADEWAAGNRVVLQRRTPDGWTTVSTRRFSPDGRARWQVSWPERRVVYRAVTRLRGERLVSTNVRISG